MGSFSSLDRNTSRVDGTTPVARAGKKKRGPNEKQEEYHQKQ